MKISMTFIIAAAIFVGGSAFVQQDVGESVQRGKEVYTTFCQNCHLESGEGIPGVNPPLAKADYLKKPTGTLIRVILEGQAEPIMVNGEKYATEMPAMNYLTDEQIADVLNYVRNSFENKITGSINAGMVKPYRKNN
ncbi:MAG TPA: cytochrome c [Panacibacter sp.]|nr:cytochrome c [Panacibacter sp.]HNP45082.1 cytochrome c [Panacibacter sp.]